MSAPTGVDTDLVTRICRDATTGSRNGPLTARSSRSSATRSTAPPG